MTPAQLTVLFDSQLEEIHARNAALARSQSEPEPMEEGSLRDLLDLKAAIHG